MQEQASDFFCFFLLSQLFEPGRLGTALSGPASRRASAMTSSGLIPRRRLTAVHFQSVERRVQRNLEGLANVRLDPEELPGCRAATLTFFLFFFKCLRGGEDSERGETKFSAGVTVTAPTTMHAEERQQSVLRDVQKCEQED